MDKANPPETWGVFKPVGHTVVTFRCDDDVQAAVSALLEQGFSTSDLARYSAEDMKALVDAELENARPLASFGYELDLIKIRRTQAQDGCSFLIVHAPDDEQAQRVAAVARATHAIAAQHYGTFMIEELSGMASGDTPMASPA